MKLLHAENYVLDNSLGNWVIQLSFVSQEQSKSRCKSNGVGITYITFKHFNKIINLNMRLSAICPSVTCKVPSVLQNVTYTFSCNNFGLRGTIEINTIAHSTVMNLQYTPQ